MTTTAVILAAGSATRMGNHSRDKPKCLFELAPGLAIMDLTLRWLREAGFDRIVVVTRREFSRLFEERYGGGIEVVPVEAEGGFGILYSLKVGIEAAGEGDFVLVMSDHVFEPEMLRRLLEMRGDSAFTLCLDANPRWDRVEEGLKVVLREGRVDWVGKRAPAIYGIDTGLFYCSSRATEIVEEVLRERGPGATVADALRRAVEDSQVDHVDVTGLLWLDVDTPEDLEEARRMLPKLLRRSLIKPGDGPVSRYLNRPVSTALSVGLYLRGRCPSPNLVSLASLALGLAGAAAAAAGRLLAAAAAVQLSSIVDGVDGEVARLCGSASRFGGALDALMDRVADLAVVAAAGIAAGVSGAPGVALVSAAAGGVFVYSYSSHLLGWASNSWVIRFRRWSPAGRDVRLLAAALFLAVGRPLGFLLYMAVVPAAASAVMLAASRRADVPGKRAPRAGIEPWRPPLPEVERRPTRRIGGEVEENLSSLLASGLWLLISLTVLTAASGAVAGLPPLELGGISVGADELIAILRTVAVVYFGYRLLMAGKFFVDLSSGWLARRLGAVTRSAVREALTDLIYLTFTAVLIWFLPAGLQAVPVVGGAAARASALTLIAVFFLITYDLAKVFYRSFRGIYDRAVGALAERLRRAARRVERRGGGSTPGAAGSVATQEPAGGEVAGVESPPPEGGPGGDGPGDQE